MRPLIQYLGREVPTSSGSPVPLPSIKSLLPLMSLFVLDPRLTYSPLTPVSPGSSGLLRVQTNLSNGSHLRWYTLSIGSPSPPETPVTHVRSETTSGEEGGWGLPEVDEGDWDRERWVTDEGQVGG